VFFVYLFAAVAGCLLVLVSIFSGGSHDGGADPGGGHTLDTSSAEHTGVNHGTAAHQDGHHGQATATAASGLGAALGWLLSVQLWTYLLAFGGLTGLLLRSVAHVGEPVASGCALAVGLGTALAARAVMRRVVGSSDSGTTSHERMVGSSAQVIIPAGPGETGKIRLTARGQTIDLLARASDGGELVADGQVSILDVRDGVAEVTRDDELPGLAALSGPTVAAAQPVSVAPLVSGIAPGSVAGANRKKEPLSSKG
jgi:hypothetical protein